PLDAHVEFIYMPDGAEVMVTAASDPNSDADIFHIPGIRTTVRQFIECVYSLAGEGGPRVFIASTLCLGAGLLWSAKFRSQYYGACAHRYSSCKPPRIGLPITPDRRLHPALS